MKNIAIYCSANNGNNPLYIEAAKNIAHIFVAHNINLVYGGASVGMMGMVADEVLSLGGTVTGIIPTSLMERELAHKGLTQLEVVASMEERKTRMIELSDGFITLPGGFGTLDEIFEVITLSQIGLHTKPFAFLNTASYYDKLAEFLDHSVQEGFIQKASRDKLIFEQDPKILLDHFISPCEK